MFMHDDYEHGELYKFQRERDFPTILSFLGLLGFAFFAASVYSSGRGPAGAGTSRGRSIRRQGQLVDLNEAPVGQLTMLSGIDHETALRIVENRPYLTKIDLVGRMIVPDATYEQIKEDITASYAA
jgi:hypothetical protein